MENRIGLSLFNLQRYYGDKKALEIAANARANAVDFSLNHLDYRDPRSVYSKDTEEFTAYFSDLKKYADELGLVVCMTHGRGTGFRNIKEEDDALVENARLDCIATKLLGAPVCVMHSVTTIYMTPACDPQLMRDLNFDMFTRILPYAKGSGIQIATETYGDAVLFDACDFFGNIDEFMKTYDRICAVGDFKDYFTICVDTGHSNKASRFHNNPAPADVIRMLGPNVSVLHLHDNDKMTDQHKIPCTGTIDWKDVLDALDEIHYQGYYNLELELRWFGEELMIESAEFAVKVMRNLLKNRRKT